jgi:hypothetical protein
MASIYSNSILVLRPIDKKAKLSTVKSGRSLSSNEKFVPK